MRSPLRRDAVNAVARARPDVAVDIDAEAIRNSGGDFGDHAALAELAVRDLEGPDVVRPVRVRPETGIGDVEQLLVGRKGEAVRAPEVVDDDAQRAVTRIEAIDVAASDLALRLAALVGRADAIGRIGEPHRAVRSSPPHRSAN